MRLTAHDPWRAASTPASKDQNGGGIGASEDQPIEEKACETKHQTKHANHNPCTKTMYGVPFLLHTIEN